MCSDCSENLHAIKTIIITTPKKFLEVGGFSTYFFGTWRFFHPFIKKADFLKKIAKKNVKIENFDFAPKWYFLVGLCLNHTWVPGNAISEHMGTLWRVRSESSWYPFRAKIVIFSRKSEKKCRKQTKKSNFQIFRKVIFFDGIVFKPYLGAWKCDFRALSGHLGTLRGVRVSQDGTFLEQK